MILIGLDDTDNITSRGTGNLAREIARELSRYAGLRSVTRHQLLPDARIPCTKNNSSAAICIESEEDPSILFDRVRSLLSGSIQRAVILDYAWQLQFPNQSAHLDTKRSMKSSPNRRRSNLPNRAAFMRSESGEMKMVLSARWLR